ncbi:anthranilate phosphoribosyltransferase [Litorimonas cladophorae]|uniref:Anthranilate phosphoribosyltransferase n=1 Tax=Litorimonas cladophorae TaxID=1220491 RepID=A0A918KBK2_9PROT|nr:anthranilate phosphoribosyltransferase [Litorimonas cladophorae]GGX57778.1 anthranilate phosphoribosyltransferase [Litorimonas cladophorae]
MNADDLRAALTAMLSGEMEAPDIVKALVQIEAEGVGAEQLTAGVAVMREHMRRVVVPEGAVDIVGTGGTGLKLLSISTATAFVVAGAGVPVAKHGNRGASSPTGTADTLSELGVNIGMSPERAAAAVSDVGMGFLFAPTYHPAMRHVGPARKQIGTRTIFNRLGPLSNPASVTHMLVGSAEAHLVRPMAEALKANGVTSAMVVHGQDGMDEITTTGPTTVAHLKDGTITEFEIVPETFGLSSVPLSALAGGAPERNAAALDALLNGELSPYREIVRLNTAATLTIAGKVTDVAEGLEMAAKSIDTGNAKTILSRLVEFSHG